MAPNTASAKINTCEYTEKDDWIKQNQHSYNV